jgi:hypothetical protein
LAEGAGNKIIKLRVFRVAGYRLRVFGLRVGLQNGFRFANSRLKIQNSFQEFRDEGRVKHTSALGSKSKLALDSSIFEF